MNFLLSLGGGEMLSAGSVAVRQAVRDARSD